MKAFDIVMKYTELENRLIDNLDSGILDKVLNGTVDYKSLDKYSRNIIQEYVEFSNSQIVFA